MHFTEAELASEILEAPARNLLPLPDTRIIERPGWYQIITPSLKQGGLNEVDVSHLDEADADRIIDETIAQYGDAKFHWDLVPGYSPKDLGERLARRGMKLSRVRAMYLSTDTKMPDAPPGVTVEEVGEATLGEFTETMGKGWGIDPGPLAAHNRQTLEDPLDRYKLFLARDRGVPAGTAGVGLFEKSAYIIGGVVLEAHRGRGLYRALVAARLAKARERGITIATVQARADTSAPILEGLGFKSLFEFSVYSNR